MNHVSYLTQEKYDELKAKLAYLKDVRRLEVAKAIEEAKALGDLSENAEYHAARAAQGELEDEIARIESVLKNAEIVTKHHSEAVDIGSTVTIRREGEKETKTYTIIGSAEADLASGKLSNDSPLGAAMMGKKKGDMFSFMTPKGETKYEVVGIE